MSYTPLILTNGIFEGETDACKLVEYPAGVVRIVVPDYHSEGCVISRINYEGQKQRVTIHKTKKTSVPKDLRRVSIFASGTEGAAPALQMIHCLLARQETPLLYLVWHTVGWDPKRKGEPTTLDIFIKRELKTLKSLHPIPLQIRVNQTPYTERSCSTVERMGLEACKPSLRLWGTPAWSAPWVDDLFVAAGSADFFKTLELPQTGNLEYTFEERRRIAQEMVGPRARESTVLSYSHSRHLVLRLTDQQEP